MPNGATPDVADIIASIYAYLLNGKTVTIATGRPEPITQEAVDEQQS